MRLFSGKIPVIAQEVVKTLTESKDIESDAPEEVQADRKAFREWNQMIKREATAARKKLAAAKRERKAAAAL